MSETKHTKGPWEVLLIAGQVRARGDQMAVCDIRGWGYLTGTGGLNLSEHKAALEQDANARLIAAAPELLEALEMVAQHAPASGPLWHGSEPMTKARAAIAKAKGES